MCDRLPTEGSEHVSRSWVARCNLAPRVDLRIGTYQNSARRHTCYKLLKPGSAFKIQKGKSKHSIKIFVIAKNQQVALRITDIQTK